MKTFIMLCIVSVAAFSGAVSAEIDILGGVLKSISQPANQQASNTSRPKYRMGTNEARFYYCTQLNRSTQDYAFAMAVFPDHLRTRFMPQGDVLTDMVNRCSSNVRQHLCDSHIIGLAGTFLTAGRPGGTAVGTAASASGPQSSPQIAGALLGGTIGAVLGTASTGKVSKGVTAGAVGALGGYSGGTVINHTVKLRDCEERKQELEAATQHLSGSLVSNDLRSLVRFFDINAQINHRYRAEIDDMKASAEALSSAAASVLQ